MIFVTFLTNGMIILAGVINSLRASVPGDLKSYFRTINKYIVIINNKVSWDITSTKNVLMHALNVRQLVIIVPLLAFQSRM